MSNRNIMMIWEHLFLYIFISSTSIGLTLTKQPSVQGNQNILLHEAVRTLLGFKESSGRSKRLLPNPDILSSEGPKYMMDLYEKFKNNRISKGHLSGNTVRSIHAQIVEVNGDTMFGFNLTSVGPTETLLSAEIHLYKKKTKKWMNRRDIEMIMYEIAPHYMAEDSKITMRAESSGWQWYDVTNSILSCLAARRKTPHLFALNFKFEKPNRKLKQIALRRFIRHHSMPFLVIYSNDTQENRFDQLDTLAAKMLQEKNTGKDISVQETQTLDNSLTNTNKDQISKPGNEFKLRGKRSIFDNEIPENPEDYSTFDRRYNIPQTHPGILQARRGTKPKLSDSRLIPYPNKSQRRKNRRRSRKNRKNKRKNKRRKNKLKFPKEWDNYHQNSAVNDKIDDVCGRRKLIVNFADIGWGDWIISPKSFEAHYCAGSCPFPLTKRLKPSNHATIQSMVHAIGIYTDVPAPCCVPDSMSSITLLYFDEQRNVVLKNYPSMTVNSCACR